MPDANEILMSNLPNCSVGAVRWSRASPDGSNFSPPLHSTKGYLDYVVRNRS